ncbi:MAG: tetratricopeptide repeat protein, partial [Bacteroidota bacterium]
MQVVGQQPVDSFAEKWLTAKKFLRAEKIDSLLPLVVAMRKVSEKEQVEQQAKINYLLAEYWHYQGVWQKGIEHSDLSIINFSKDTLHPLLLAEAHLLKGSCLHELDEWDQALTSYKQSLFLKQKTLGQHHLKVSNLHFNIGYILQEKRDLLASDSAFFRGINVLRAIYREENEEFADFYEELGFNQSFKGDFKGAADYLQK